MADASPTAVRSWGRLSWILGNLAELIPQSYAALWLMHGVDGGREDLVHVGMAVLVSVPSFLAICISAVALTQAPLQVIKGFTWAMSLVLSVPLILLDSPAFGITVIINGLLFALLLPTVGGSRWGIAGYASEALSSGER